VNVTQDTVNQENREGEENHNLDVELCRVYGVHPAESQEGEHPIYGDEGLEVDCQGTTGVKPHIKYCFGEKNIGVLAEDRENCFILISDNEDELQSAGVKEEISYLHGIESDSTVGRSDVEDNQHKENEDTMGKNNVEGEVKEENSDLHGIESDCTAGGSDVEDNSYKGIKDSMGESNLETTEVKGKTDPHGIESELTLAHNNSEACSSCDSSDNMSGNKSEQQYPRKADYFSSGDVPQFISIFAASNVSISENNDSDGECPLFCESTTMKPIAIGADSLVSRKECSAHCSRVGCCMNEYICGAGQYHQRKEDDLTEDDRRKLVRCFVEHSVDKRNGLTGSDGEAEKISELYAEREGSQVAKGDNIPVGQTSSDIVAQYPLSPKADLDNDGEIYLVPGCVQGDVISHLKDHENVLDTAQLNTKMNETHCGEFEGEQREETGKQGCPVWQILEQLECPFNWVPDICIKRTPGGTIQENMVDHLTGKPTLMIQFVK
jgi:hypothetical protein